LVENGLCQCVHVMVRAAIMQHHLDRLPR
jgi:hypothetical protein